MSWYDRLVHDDINGSGILLVMIVDGEGVALQSYDAERSCAAQQ